jgi:hypothetical protein
MKLKILLCLAFGLSGSLFGCSTTISQQSGLKDTVGPHWGVAVGGFQMAASVDASNTVIHCWIRNGLSKAITYNDFFFGYGEDVGVQIRQGTEWVFVNAIVFPGGNGARGAIPPGAKVRWLQPEQIVTNTWNRRDTIARLPYRKGDGNYMRKASLADISAGDTFILDLADSGWSTKKIQPGIYEARVRQDFYSASPHDPYPYIHGPKLTLYSPVFTLNFK